MIDILEDFPDTTVALRCQGRVTREDYENILIPRVNAVLARHGKVRIYYEIGPDVSGFEAGAVWEDTKLGFEHLTRWERVALGTDLEWVRVAVGAFRFLMPGRLRLFHGSEASQARAWVTAQE